MDAIFGQINSTLLSIVLVWFVKQTITLLNTIVWDWLIVLLLGLGFYFTWRTRFLQFRRFGYMFKLMAISFKQEKEGISSFQAYCTSLAGRVGTGNLAGVSLAVIIGGPGAVFWMWVVAMIGMITGCVESSLAQLYKINNPEENSYRGGPAYYMQFGLKKRWMGILFSVLLLACYGFVFNAVQSDSISNAFVTSFNIPPWLTGLTLVILTSAIIFGGIQRISKVAELVVPFMAIAYLLLAFYVVIINITELPEIIVLIVKNAFGMKKVAAGAIGATIAKALQTGTRRGLFSNEAGMGSAPNAAATAEVKHPVEQGIIQMFGVFTDTIVICTCTAFIVIASGKYTMDWHGEGISLTQAALSAEVGNWGAYFIAIALFFFAFTSIIANYYYGENCLHFIESKHKAIINGYRILVLVVVVAGTLSKSDMVWATADLFMGLMATVNLIALMLLSKQGLAIIKDYDTQVSAGKDPVFNPSNFPEFEKNLAPDVWHRQKTDGTPSSQ